VTRREFLWMAAAIPARAQTADLKVRMAAVLRKHLDSLLSPDGSVARLKGKAADGMMAACFEIAHETFGEARYHAAALQLADRVLAGMRKMPVGVLAIKEKDKPGDKVMGGGPPALGWYAAALGHVCNRPEDLRYVAGVLDRFAWNPKGWWAATVDVKDGHSPLPMDKPSPVNKNAGMALACATLSEAAKDTDAQLAASLREKTLRCLHDHILPAQLPDGFWHYGLTGRDPNNKDVHGYFLLTTELLIALTEFAPSFRDAALEKAIAKAEAYAAKNIAPNTDPYTGKAAAPKTASTPAHYDVAADPKRGYMLSVALVHGKYNDQAEKIAGNALDHFPSGDRGQDGAHCAYAMALCQRSPGVLTPKSAE
jgi:hypothetical protein